MKKCAFITVRDALHGFTLAGFRQIISDANGVVAEFERIVAGGEPGLVIIDERLLTEGNTAKLHALERRWDGALVILPEPAAEEAADTGDYGTRLIARVLGYQMKLTI